MVDVGMLRRQKRWIADQEITKFLENNSKALVR